MKDVTLSFYVMVEENVIELHGVTIFHKYLISNASLMNMKLETSSSSHSWSV